MKAVATVLSNNILLRAKREGIKVTPMKLQKLLYYVCVKFVQETGTTPISEQFEVWQYGPVAPSVYSEFKPYGASPIKQFAKNARGEAKVVDEDANPLLADCINYVWSRYKNYSGIELSRKTHQKGSGWYAAYQGDRDAISVEEMQSDTTI